MTTTPPPEVSEALREALAKVPDEWTPMTLTMFHDFAPVAVMDELQQRGFVEGPYSYTNPHFRRTALGRSLMEQKG